MKHLSVKIEQNPQEQFYSACNKIALESYTEGVGMELFNDSFEIVANTVEKVFNNSFDLIKDLSVTRFFKNFTFESEVKKLNYAAIDQLKITIPEGFTGNAKEYCQELAAQLRHVSTVVNEVIVPFNQYVSALISDKDFAKAYKSKPNYLHERDAKREDMNKTISKYFGNGTLSSNKLSQHYRTSEEISETDKLTEDLSELLSASNVVTVRKMVTDSVDLINSLQELISKNQIGNLSESHKRLLAEMCSTIAREVEFYAITRYRADSFVNTFVKTKEAIKKII